MPANSWKSTVRLFCRAWFSTSSPPGSSGSVRQRAIGGSFSLRLSIAQMIRRTPRTTIRMLPSGKFSSLTTRTSTPTADRRFSS